MQKTVAVVEDDRKLREQLVSLLKRTKDISCTGAYASAEEALPRIINEQPAVVLMDIKLPGMSGIQCVTEIRKISQTIQVIMVTAYDQNDNIFEALKAGANGFIIKSDSPELLVDAVRNVCEGGGPMSIPIARKVIQHFSQTSVSIKDGENLSSREREILNLLSQGFIYKEIASRLEISATTVRTYVQRICHKMHVRSRLEAIAKHK